MVHVGFLGHGKISNSTYWCKWKSFLTGSFRWVGCGLYELYKCNQHSL